MKTPGWAMLAASLLSVGCASGGTLRAGGLSSERGVMLVPGGSVKAIVLGPKVVHTFSTGAGGNLYTARAVTGSDADCQEGTRKDPDHSVSIVADRRATLGVAEGEIACLATTGPSEFELLWHARSDDRTGAPATFMLANGVRQHTAVHY